MGACNACVCGDPIGAIKNDACFDDNLGGQIVKIFIEKITGVDFDGTTPYTSGTKGGTVTLKSDWDLRTASTGDDKIIVLNAVGTKPSADPNLIDVEYGGKLATDRPQTLELELLYTSAQTIIDVNKAQCYGAVKISFLDNNDYLYTVEGTLGKFIPNATLVFKGLEQAGFGTKAKIGLTVNWNSLCLPVPINVAGVATRLPFLRAVKN